MGHPKPLEKIPEHLVPYIAEQDASLYTPIDHAAWRYIMRVSKNFFPKHAHKKYLDGLKETGISTERIPLIKEMDEHLRKFGWRAVGVSGFIPPAVFMEFQSLGILPIACEMRKLEHIAYTPAPDIVHEAAGHAPIIADKEYSSYLRAYGEVARKAIFSSQDMDVYRAILNLSVVKEDPESTEAEIEEAQEKLEHAKAAQDYVSEATYLARMNWWTVEYGLVGSYENPYIYGAGLLSSVGESYHCLGDEVRKIPISLDCINMSYDITRPQPQLYVTPDFRKLTEILEEFSETMAFKKGGLEGLSRAKTAATVTTCQYDSGLQVSGVLANFLTDKNYEPCYLKFAGPCQLSYEDTQLESHSPEYHGEGFGSPVGRLKDGSKSSAELSKKDLEKLGFKGKEKGKLEFESGVVVEGVFTGSVRRRDRNLILTFENCRVSLGNQTLFDPDWGTFDMACGDEIVSVFGGAADRPAYLDGINAELPPQARQKSNRTEENRELCDLYGQVRELRQSLGTSKGSVSEKTKDALIKIHEKLEEKYPEDWLLRLELLEVDHEFNLELKKSHRIRNRLQEICQKTKVHEELISRGLAVLGI